MPDYDSVKENFKFIILEVIKQAEDTARVLEDPTEKRISKIVSRDDYIDNLKGIIANRSYRFLLDSTALPQSRVDLIRSINVITSNLENIADFCTNIVNQLAFLSSASYLEPFDFKIFFKEIIPALHQIEHCLFDADVDQALKICRTEFILDVLYMKRFHKIMKRLRSGEDPKNLISTLFIFRYFERIGDCLLNIGEAAISAAIGEKMKIQQFHALEGSMVQSNEGEPVEKDENGGPLFVFESVGETKSGCRIGRAREKDKGDKAQWVIFKEGNSEKLEQEKTGIEAWEEILPGLPPRIIGTQQFEQNASLLLEFLEGTTFQKIVLNQNTPNIIEALLKIQEVLQTVWNKTKKSVAVSTDYMGQVRNRINDVFKVHPEFDSPFYTIGSLEIPSFNEVLHEVSEIERDLVAPFTVFIHGDFNTDNLLYNLNTKRVNFIDLHRSRHMDYVQDISVFLISNFRLPIFEEKTRDKLNWVTVTFYRFAREYANQHGDHTFDARLTLGLIRSFITSTRFVLKDEFSKNMFHRAGYLMKKLIGFKRSSWDAFELPMDVLTF